MNRESEKEGNEESQDVFVSEEAKKVGIKSHSTEAVTTIITRPEVVRLLEKEEYSAALLVTAVNLEHILEQHLKSYKAENEGSVENNYINCVINNLDHSLGTYKKRFDAIYEQSDCPPKDTNIDKEDWVKPPIYTGIDKADWEKKKEEFQDLVDIRYEIAHVKGSFENIRERKHETYNNKEKIKDLIDSVYDFCHQHPVK